VLILLKNIYFEEITFEKFVHLIDHSDDFNLFLEMVRKDLYQKYSSIAFHEKFRNLMSNTSTDCQPQRYAEMFCAKEGKTFVGIVIIHYYDWKIVSPQICYKFGYSTGVGNYLSLSKFSNLIQGDLHNIKQVADIATIWLTPQFRRQGIGECLFTKAVRIINKKLTPQDYYFLAAVSQIKPDISEQIFNLMVELEGLSVTDISQKQTETNFAKVPLSLISDRIGLENINFDVREGSKAIEGFALSQGMEYIGHFRNFSKIFGSFILFDFQS